MKHIFLAIFAITLVFTAGCTSTRQQTSAHFGPLSATGTLIPVEVSLVRRGTHALVIGGTSTYFVESKTVNLRAYEGKVVSIKGTLEANSHVNELPVLVALDLKPVRDDESLHVWDIPLLNLRIIAPQSWAGSIQKNVASFTLPKETEPVLTVTQSETLTLPTGTPVYVGNRRGVRTTAPGNGPQDVYLQQKNGITHLHFDSINQKTVQKTEDAQILSSQFENLVSSIHFLSETTGMQTMSGSGIGTPCGGSAGVLCPQGYFCNIEDVSERIGKCKKL